MAEIVKLSELEGKIVGSFEECALAQAKTCIDKMQARNEPRMGIIIIGVTEPAPNEAHTIHAGLVEPCGNDSDEAHVLVHKLDLMQTAVDSLTEQIKQDYARLRLIQSPTPTDPEKVN